MERHIGNNIRGVKIWIIKIISTNTQILTIHPSAGEQMCFLDEQSSVQCEKFAAWETDKIIDWNCIDFKPLHLPKNGVGC